MENNKPIPNAPVYVNLRNRGIACIGIATTKEELEKAREKGLIIFEPRLNYSESEYKKIIIRRKELKKYGK